MELHDPQQVILNEIANRAFTRDSVALTYAFCILQRDEVDFSVVNRAILDRWSPYALEYIKAKAWKMCDDR